MVFSNAVVEHVGSRAEQAAFVRELCRIGRAVFLTTPNRWFPFEHHTGVPILHFLPASVFRSLLRPTRFAHWADESNLNILTARELAEVFPAHVAPTISVIRLMGLPVEPRRVLQNCALNAGPAFLDRSISHRY